MKISGGGERLADQGRADDVARLVADQTAIGLSGKGQLADASHRERIGEAQQKGEQGDHDDRGAKGLQHQNTALMEATARAS